MDTLRFAVEPVLENVNRGFEVQIFINDVEMTSAGAGLGMDTNDLLLPSNKFHPRNEPHQVAVARCECGVYGCGSTDILVTSDVAVVHWDWLIEKPMRRRVTFDRDAYVQEVERLEFDRSWETPERVATRLVAKGAASLPLVERGLRYAFSGNYHADPTIFSVSLSLGDQYQVFLHIPWNDRAPGQLAQEIISVLDGDPTTWHAKWHGISPECRAVPPQIAGANWDRYRF